MKSSFPPNSPNSGLSPGNPHVCGPNSPPAAEPGCAEMCTDQGGIYVTNNTAQTWKAAVEETVDATLNRTVPGMLLGVDVSGGQSCWRKPPTLPPGVQRTPPVQTAHLFVCLFVAHEGGEEDQRGVKKGLKHFGLGSSGGYADRIITPK